MPRVKGAKNGDVVEGKLPKKESSMIAQNSQSQESTSTVRQIKGNDGKDVWVQACPYCPREVCDLTTHIQVNHKDKEWRGIKTKCPFPDCDKVNVDIKNHIRNVHEKVRNFHCHLCDSKFGNKKLLQTHIDCVHKQLKEKCPHCDMMLKVSCLQVHIKKVHNGERKSVPCSAGCEKTYTSKADMERHVLRVHLKYKVKCDFCEKEISPDQMGRHVKKAHHGVFNFYCPICQAGFDFEHTMKMHINRMHTGTFIVCNLPKLSEEGRCPRKFWNEKGLYEHFLGHLQKDTKMPCAECDEEVYSSFLEHHVSIQHVDGKVGCRLDGCPKEFAPDEDQLAHYQAEHSSLLENMEWCSLCNLPTFHLETHSKKFHNNCDLNWKEFHLPFIVRMAQMCKEDGCKFFAINRGSLSRHTRYVHGKTLQVQCDVCNRRYENVEKHIEEYHATEAKIPCDTCGKLFLTLEKLRHHRIVHTREKKVCEICHTEVVQMKQHMALVHSSYRKYACTVEGCNTTFFNKLAYRKHMLHVHEGVKYTCELCNKEVVNLKSHIRLVHKKIRSHECPECKKTFQTQPYLRLHIARVHLGVKETCPDCGKQVSNVKSHQLYVHQGMRNFPCDQCETRCHTRRALKDHINSVHLGERVKCPDCGLRFGKNSLPKHRKGCYASHTYAKHQCIHCKERFRLKCNLERHLQTKHLDKQEIDVKEEIEYN